MSTIFFFDENDREVGSFQAGKTAEFRWRQIGIGWQKFPTAETYNVTETPDEVGNKADYYAESWEG